MERSNSKAIEKMDVKKPHAAKAVDGKKVVEFVGEVKEELRKVEWTSKSELLAYTKIVLASTFLFGMLIYFSDLIIQGFLNVIQMLVKAIVG